MIKIRPQLALFLGSVLALGGALLSQYGFGYQPCEMCIWQRIPYALIILFTIMLSPQRRLGSRLDSSFRWNDIILYLSLLLIVVEVLLAILHVGVEQHWWEGFTACSSNGSAGSLEDLKAKIMSAPIIRCDQPSLVVLGLSMAGWNVLFSSSLLVFTGYLWRKKST